jgi:hypothetical protein
VVQLLQQQPDFRSLQAVLSQPRAAIAIAIAIAIALS